MILYNSIGSGYNCSRQTDKRIVEKLVQLLDLSVGSTIADLGAGTGNYSNAIADLGYQVIAIEPSAVMQNQAIPHSNVRWLTGTAEQIPLEDNSVAGIVVMLAMHHFSNIPQAITEMERIVDRGKVVIFAFEQSKIPDFWLTKYFPYFIQDTLVTFPSTEEIADKIQQITQKQVQVTPFLLPPDLTDLFAAAGWCRPEIYLDAQVRQGISSFAKMSEEEIKQGLDQLTQDLQSGEWDRQYGELRNQPSYDAGYRIIVF